MTSLPPPPSTTAPPPPPIPQSTTTTTSPYITNIAKSMTIEEMRNLHKLALNEAESKRTELRLVLASRYRELVGSSDEVLHMQKRAKELDDLVNGLKSLVDKLVVCAHLNDEQEEKMEEKGEEENLDMVVNQVRHDLSRLPRLVHRFLDQGDVHGATTHLLQLFTLIVGDDSDSNKLTKQQKSEFKLALALSSSFATKTKSNSSSSSLVTMKSQKNITKLYQASPLLQTQAKMTFLHSQTLPSRIVKMSKKLLLQPASYALPSQYVPANYKKEEEANYGAFLSASALSTLDMLDINPSINSIASINNKSFENIRGVNLIDLYYESKAKLIHDLLTKLSSADASSSGNEEKKDGETATMGEAEVILTQIVLILQYDVILHPYQIFVLRKFPTPEDSSSDTIMSTLPTFDLDVLKSKSSHFLAAHLPLIRSKVKTVLITIAGTTASRLGHIRQILYDKTDGVDCRDLLDSSGVCTWEEAVGNMVDVRVVSHGTSFTATTGGSNQQQESLDGNANPPSTAKKFSLWSALFSSAFSSLVHSLLTTSFHSVHSRILSALRASLANAPPLHRILPHEAHCNALRIATELDVALKKVSDDAHELLVHAEEREESERRLRQSLYVQTCEIMGRLLSELRRMLIFSSSKENVSKDVDATKELIVGRLCHLLKFRLTSLPKLLDPNSSPSAIMASSSSNNKSPSSSLNSMVGVGGNGGNGGTVGGKSGMITLMELQSSFDLADDDDDGLISFEEAMEAMESAFSGTPFRGAEMVRDTLLLSSSSAATAAKDKMDLDGDGGVLPMSPTSGGLGVGGSSHGGIGPRNVTLSELALLSARGLRHDATGPYSARGTVQRALDDIVSSCFQIWGKVALCGHLDRFKVCLNEFVQTASGVSSKEFERQCGLYKVEEEKGEHELLMDEIGDVMDEGEGKKKKEIKVGGVSSYITSYLLSASSVLNRSICPSDSLPPVPSAEYAKSLGVTVPSEQEGGFESIPNMMYTLRGAVLGEALSSLCEALDEYLVVGGKKKKKKGENDEEENEEEEEEDLADVTTSAAALPSLEEFNSSALVQLLLDVTFVKRCFFERNHYGFVVSAAAATDAAMDDALLSEYGGGEELDDLGIEGGYSMEEDTKNFVDKSKGILEDLVEDVSTRLASGDVGDNDGDVEEDGVDVPQLLDGPVRDRHMEVFTSCDLFLSSLFGEDSSMSSSSATTSLYGMGLSSSTAAASNASAASLILNPLPSSRRFVLLPIQAERSLNELQLRGKYGKNRSDSKAASNAGKEEAPSSGTMSAGFGFFSSMLKKK